MKPDHELKDEMLRQLSKIPDELSFLEVRSYAHNEGLPAAKTSALFEEIRKDHYCKHHSTGAARYTKTRQRMNF